MTAALPSATRPRRPAGRRLLLPGAGRWLARAASLLACLAAWQLASRLHLDLGLVTFRNVPPPGEVGEAAVELVRSAKLVDHVTASLWRVFMGFGLGAVAGVALGVAIGRSQLASDLLSPPLELLRPIPAVAWLPLAILMFPSSELSMIFITFTGALFPILLGAIHGVESIDARLVASARSLGAGRWAILREVALPAAAPTIFAGLAIGMGTSWFCLVSAEMISGQFGVGYYTWESYTIQNYPGIIVGMILIGLLGMGSSALLRHVGAKLTPWRDADEARR